MEKTAKNKPKKHDVDELFGVIDMTGKLDRDSTNELMRAMKEIVMRVSDETRPDQWLNAEEIPAPIKLPPRFFRILKEVHAKYNCCGLDVADLGASLLNSLVVHALGCFVSAIELQDKLGKKDAVDSKYRASSRSIASILDTID